MRYFYAVFVFTFSAILHPVTSRVDRLRPDEKQRSLLHETFKDLLKFDQDDGDQPPLSRPVTKSARAASKYMRRLFDRYRKNEISDSGLELGKRTVVRAITPKLGTSQNLQALIFDLQPISSTESLVKARVHYYLGSRRFNDEPSPKIHCYLLTPSSSPDGEPIEAELPPVPIDDRVESKHWVVFDASPFLNSTVLGNASVVPATLAVLFAGSEGVRPRFFPARKALRFHAPFLSVSTRDSAALSIGDPIDNQETDDNDDEDSSDQDRRRKRNVDTKYYEYYHPYETPYTTSPNDVAFNNWRSPSDPHETTTSDFVQRGPSVLRRSGPKKSRRNRKHNRRGFAGRREYLDDNGAWDPLEQDDPTRGKGRKKKYGKVLKAKDGDRNPTTVVLMDHEASATCQRNDLVIDFRDIGWGDYVIAPSSFDAHYCAGSCPFPIPPTVNATNHAILLDIVQKLRLQSEIPKPCCAPDKMDSLSLLYYDASGNVVLTTYPKMSVVSCACL